jgi:hypothetical protein
VGLEPIDLASPVAGRGGDHLAVLVDDPDCGVSKLDGDGLTGVSHADLDALTRDLDATARGKPSRNGSPSRPGILHYPAIFAR